ncbi:GTPase Era [Candidatus Uhrbacteria bacterium]|mgnify:FL=1|jgi:GTPase|nr:GTPase Era [Candidatus Uhrbacteria bacterium]MBT7717381.1 GTPase Era [Candidatus Uhrbacteria bacterium]
MNKQPFKSGFAVLIGRSNVGKSTLLNTLVGTKVAITTPKPQTTRFPIQGVVHDDRGQIVFVDTPGVMQKAKDELTKKLLDSVRQSLHDIDVLIYVVDPTRQIGNEEKQTLKMIEGVDKPKLLVINKVDERSAQRNIDFYRDLLEDHFDGAIELSALKGTNMDILKDWIFEHLPEGDAYYEKSQISNIGNKERIAELIREKLFLRLREEVPYSVHVDVHEIEERKNGIMYIRADVLTTEDRYKRMIIGKGARGIKEISQSTRNELENVTGKKIFLDMEVKVDSHWVNRFN